MIRIPSTPEYMGFDADVRRPGRAFLATNPNPSSNDFKKKNFWNKAARELREAYSGVCAYTSMYLAEGGTVDHFLPKAKHPLLAYEWSNYRFASARVNNSKGDLTDIVDPFVVENDWFIMDIPACLLKANPALDGQLKARISGTINSLRLNQDDNYVQERCTILMDYAGGDVTLAFLSKRYPFLAKEVERQNLDQAGLRTRFGM